MQILKSLKSVNNIFRGRDGDAGTASVWNVSKQDNSHFPNVLVVFNCQLDTVHTPLRGEPPLRNCLHETGL